MMGVLFAGANWSELVRFSLDPWRVSVRGSRAGKRLDLSYQVVIQRDDKWVDRLDDLAFFQR